MLIAHLAYGGTRRALDLSSVGLRQLDRTGLPFQTVWAKRLTQQKPKTKVIIMNNGIAGKVAVITAASSFCPNLTLTLKSRTRIW